MARSSEIKRALKKQRRKIAHASFMYNITKERAIGVHPKYLHSYRRQWREPTKEFERLSARYDREHGTRL